MLFTPFPFFLFPFSEVCEPSVHLVWSNNYLQSCFPESDITKAGRPNITSCLLESRLAHYKVSVICLLTGLLSRQHRKIS